MKRRSPRLLGKMKTIPNTSADPVNVGDEDSQSEDNGGYSGSSTVGDVSGEGVAQDVIQDNPQVLAECENNVDLGVPPEGNSVGSDLEPIQMVLPTTASHTDSRSPFPASGSSNLTKESPIVTSCGSTHDEFQHFDDDAKALLFSFASSNPSFVLPADLNPLFRKLGYQAFLDAWEFFTANTFADLWDAHRDMGSKEEILSKEYDSLSSGVSALQEKIDTLTTELNTMKAKLAGVCLEREQLAKAKEDASSAMTCDDLL
ncbi:hypothetical protein PIB30_051518 [Stylosanthes scabra]|uniref:Uncharacterized protein n=1 Tax=Stylosanthes scabra TaxID=79078 RepID=A0ABU6TIU0_9FABA|nr:hypothetical protein [Stylosanthes scabra]